jgi:hypothetical protein
MSLGEAGLCGAHAHVRNMAVGFAKRFLTTQDGRVGGDTTHDIPTEPSIYIRIMILCSGIKNYGDIGVCWPTAPDRKGGDNAVEPM